MFIKHKKQLVKSQVKIREIAFGGKKVILLKLSKGVFSKSIEIGMQISLFEVKVDFVSEHLPDDFCKLASTVYKGIAGQTVRKPDLIQMTCVYTS